MNFALMVPVVQDHDSTPRHSRRSDVRPEALHTHNTVMVQLCLRWSTCRSVGNEALSEQTDLKSVTEHNRMGGLSKTFINANEGYTRHVLGDLEQWMTVNCV